MFSVCVFAVRSRLVSAGPHAFIRPVAVAVAGTVTLAQEALAGLASKENFSQVALRKTASFGSSTPGAKLQPYKSTMLMHVKGRHRRHQMCFREIL